MANIGIKASPKNIDCNNAENKDLSWTSSLYQHSIGFTGFKQTTSANETTSHYQSYIPIVLAYNETTTANKYAMSFTGSAATRIEISTISGDRVRYYIFFQNV